jgi:hypothetical protein
MAQTNIAIYLSITNWLVIFYTIYYCIMKLLYLPKIKSKLYIKSNFSTPKLNLILQNPQGLGFKYPIFYV